MTTMMWKWSNGETYYRSARKENIKNVLDVSYDTKINAINQSLNEELFLSSSSIFLKNNREDLDIKMSDREMVVQCGANPFSQTSYVNDVMMSEIYLKPVNTTSERVKNGNNDNA